MPRYRVTLAYDGTDFAGSQAQPGQRTVQGELELAIGKILGERTRATFAGRTDRGVHATGQVSAFDAPNWRWGARELMRSLNASLPRDLRVLEASETSDAFHPRFDAAWREYRYWIAPRAVNPFLGRVAWLVRADVELPLMAVAAQHVVGTHDFASFAGGGEGVPWSDRVNRARGTTRTMVRCTCRESEVNIGPGAGADRVIEIVAMADGFLPRMVRNIVGALLEVGQGRESPDWITELLGHRDRRLGSVLAPAQGLSLTAVVYGDDTRDDWRPVQPGRRGTDEGAV